MYYSQIKTKFRKVNNRHYNHGLMVFPKINWLTTSFCLEKNITELRVLEKPQIYETEYGDKLQCVVGCDDGSVRMLDINKSKESRIVELGFNLDSLLEMTLKIRIESISKTRKSIFIEDMYEKRQKHLSWYNRST